MKAHRFLIGVLDFEGYGRNEIISQFHNSSVEHIIFIEEDSREIGEWHDDHPLNSSATQTDFFNRLFAQP